MTGPTYTFWNTGDPDSENVNYLKSIKEKNMKKFITLILALSVLSFSSAPLVPFSIADTSATDVRLDPKVVNLTLTSANTEYSIAFPAWTKKITLQCRTAYDVRVSHETGKVAGSTSPFWTIKSGGGYYEIVNFKGTLYFASSQAGVVVEAFCWGNNTGYES